MRVNDDIGFAPDKDEDPPAPSLAKEASCVAKSRSKASRNMAIKRLWLGFDDLVMTPLWKNFR